MSSMEMGSLSAEPHKDELVATISALAERVAELEARVAQDGVARPLDFSNDKMATIASSIYRSRQMRGSYFKGSLLTDPAWDMLLYLFIHKIQGRRVSSTGLCLAVNVPQTTANRWVDVLHKEGLLDRRAEDDAERPEIVEISADGFRQMRRFIVDSVTRFDMPMPD